MKWATKDLIHYDRVATCWLITRFVDPDAEFVFVPPGEAAPADATPFALPGALLAGHDEEMTTFQRVLAAYDLKDPALARLGRVLKQGVEYIVHDASADGLRVRDPLIGGFLALAEGVMLLSADDHECLSRSMDIYDCFFARLCVDVAFAAGAPYKSVLDETLALVNAIRAMRRDGVRFSSEEFSARLA